MQNRLLPLIAIMMATLLILAGCAGQTAPEQEQPEPIQTVTDSAVHHMKTHYNQLTGKYMEVKGTPLMAVINHQPEARPQTGLMAADIVYEVETEGMITRLVAVYYGSTPPDVGPIRSARPYILALAREWGTHMVHVGGSNDAYALIPAWGIKNIDSIRGDRGFWVDPNRRAPHNTYITTSTALANKNPAIKFPRWDFSGVKAEAPDYIAIAMRYDGLNRPGYTWDEEIRAYKRSISGNPHVDRLTGEQITVDNLIIQYATHVDTGNELGHVDVKLIGQGQAEYFLGGNHSTGSWSKSGLDAPTVFLDNQGKQIKKVPGNTWIQVVQIGRASCRVR